MKVMEYTLDEVFLCLMEGPSGIYTDADMEKNGYFNCIAYIDDNAMDTWIAVKVLELAGICREIITEVNGVKGWRLLEDYAIRNGRLPEVIMVDLQMPLMDGFDLINKIRSSPFYSPEEVRILLVSAGLDDSDLKRMEELDIRDHVVKPLDVAELSKMLLQWKK